MAVAGGSELGEAISGEFGWMALGMSASRSRVQLWRVCKQKCLESLGGMICGNFMQIIRPGLSRQMSKAGYWIFSPPVM
jgi:hypothetical protein